MINEARAKQEGFAPVEFVFVDMVLATKDEGKGAKDFSNKASSTYIREYLEKEKQKAEKES